MLQLYVHQIFAKFMYIDTNSSVHSWQILYVNYVLQYVNGNADSLDIMRQTACLVVNPIIVDGYASLFNCTTAVLASDSMTVSS